jgi:hypothetical protein
MDLTTSKNQTRTVDVQTEVRHAAPPRLPGTVPVPVYAVVKGRTC